jgi:predicted regulator of Ras-like GTPase activity (Roadblock/LC7/MglB family)
MSNLNETLSTIMSIDGAMGAAVVDFESGLLLARAGGGVDLDLAAAGNTEVVRAKMATMRSLSINETIEDMLITLETQYHIIRPMPTKKGLFIYVVLNKAKSNLALARFKIKEAESKAQI